MLSLRLAVFPVLLAALASLASVAHAAPCKDAAACTAACDSGDPAACVASAVTKFRPLSDDKLTDAAKKATDCDDYEMGVRCTRFAAHLWAGVGVKVQRDAATAIWHRECSTDNSPSDACLAYAKAIESTKQAEAVELYRDMCQRRDIDLACRAAGRIWTRVNAEVRGRKFSIELPSVMRHIEPWSSGSWHVLWSSSTMRPDVEIRVESGQLACKAAPQSPGDPNGKYADIVARYAAKYGRLPSDWATRICKSLRPE